MKSSSGDKPKKPNKHTQAQVIKTTAKKACDIGEQLDEKVKYIYAAAVTAFAGLPISEQIDRVAEARREYTMM